MEHDFQEESSSENISEEESERSERQHKTKKRKHEDVAPDEVKYNGVSQKRKHKNELYKPPTVEELNNLKETENLYNNNLFRLQIQELISEIGIKNKRKKKLLIWLQSFQTVIDKLTEHTDIPLSSIKRMNLNKNRSVKITKKRILMSNLAEYPKLFCTDNDITLNFLKPESIEKFGLYENNCSPGPNLFLNVNLKIPKNCFLPKDYLNNRYLCKRYYYLLYIAQQLKLSGIITSTEVNFHEGNPLLPILKIQPKECNKTTVMIYATPSQGYFKTTRFLPELNNLKQDLFNTKLDNDTLKNSPTIMYNSSLCHDVTLSENSDFLRQCFKEQNSIQEGIKLLIIWLQQRELNVGIGSITENLILYFIVYLLSKKKINTLMSSYQIIRNFWNFVSMSDLQNEPISIANSSKEVLDHFKNYFDIVCLDKSGCYNVASFLSLDVYKKFKVESELAIKCLDSYGTLAFQQLFLTKIPFYLQFDVVVDLTVSLPLRDTFIVSNEDKAKFCGFQDLLRVNYILTTLKKALNKRLLSIVPRLEVEDNSSSLKKIFFGCNLNPEEAFNFIELGPTLNDHVAAAEFRNFWAHLSSDRRFRDGSTHVAVYFKTNTIKGKRGIINKIFNFVIENKLGLQYQLHYDEFEEVLISKRLIASYPSGTNEEISLKVIHASDELGKKLRALQMSLKITGVQGVSDVYSFTDIFPPVPTNYTAGHSVTAIQGNSLIISSKKPGLIPLYIQPIECVLQLEHSSKWPNDLEALRHIKTSFYLEISKMLHANHQIISNVTPDYIDVSFEGLIFRYRLHVPKEISLVKKDATDMGLTYYKDSLESFKLEMSLDILPKVVGALKGLQSLYPSFGPGTALIKRWLRSQLIDTFLFPDIAINLLNASLYLNSASVQPNTPQLSFLRFLKFFSDFDWNLQAVIVNFNDDITNEQIAELEAKLQQNRVRYPPIYVIMSFDEGSSVFTKYAPIKEVLYRVKQLAKESLNFTYNIIAEQNQVGIKELFIPNFDGYNILIHLRPLMNPRRHEQIAFATVDNRIVLEKYKESGSNKLPIIDFNPVEEYLTTLRKNYGKYAMFFHDTYGGNTIGVLWNPTVFKTLDFKVSGLNAGMLVGDKVAFNMDAVIEDFYIIGKGLVKMIDKVL